MARKRHTSFSTALLREGQQVGADITRYFIAERGTNSILMPVRTIVFGRSVIEKLPKPLRFGIATEIRRQYFVKYHNGHPIFRTETQMMWPDALTSILNPDGP